MLSSAVRTTRPSERGHKPNASFPYCSNILERTMKRRKQRSTDAAMETKYAARQARASNAHLGKLFIRR